MAFLTLTLSGTTITLKVTQFAEQQPEPVGKVTASASGVLRSSVRANRRKWTATALFPSRAAWVAAHSLIYTTPGAFLTVTGTALDSASVVCAVEMTGTSYVQEAGGLWHNEAALALTQVTPG